MAPGICDMLGAASAPRPIPLKSASSLLLRLLLCASLVLNGIGSAAAGAWVAAVDSAGVPVSGGEHLSPGCGHAPADGDTPHAGDTSDLHALHGSGHGEGDCLDACLDMCVHQCQALPGPLPALHVPQHADPLAPHAERRAPSPHPASLIRPPIA